jgi:elongation factor P--beta-lysine ligase
MITKNHPFLMREQVIKAIRQFFDDQDFQEITTPVLNKALPLEPNLYAFETNWQAMQSNQALYLSTSPEAALKKMLALGLKKVYAIGHSFRNKEPADIEHNPEFLMLEWYRAEADHESIMADTEALVQFLFDQLNTSKKQFNLTSPWPRFSLEKLFNQKLRVSLKEILSIKAIQTLAKSKGYDIEHSTWDELFNQLFMNELEVELGKEPFFLTDFPAQISPLCMPQTKKPYLAQRFEVYLNGLEIGNGNTEQTNAQLVVQHFSKEQAYRQQQNLSQPAIDQDFLQALATLHQTGKKYAGIGLGIERLVMILSGQENLADINPFTL